MRQSGSSTRMSEIEMIPISKNRMALSHMDQPDCRSRIDLTYTASETLDRVKSFTRSVGTEIGMPIDSSP